jgi:hypothetical protein
MNFSSMRSHFRRFRSLIQGSDAHERTLELLGAMLARDVASKHQISSLHEVEFRVFSQWGDDGIIQWLVAQMPTLPKRFVEFGVEDYSESNTRFLIVNNNWCGLVIDGSQENIDSLRRRKWFWRYGLTAISQFITGDNIDEIIRVWAAEDKVGLLHIDIDGNDFWIWKAIQCITPPIVIVEYNALFGPDRLITVPYAKDFDRHQVHYSGQYAGASLAALTWLSEKKGYALVGTNSAGNNAYYVHTSHISPAIKPVSVEAAFTISKFRDSRDQRHRLNYLSYKERQSLIRGLPVLNVMTGTIEPF